MSTEGHPILIRCIPDFSKSSWAIEGEETPSLRKWSINKFVSHEENYIDLIIKQWVYVTYERNKKTYTVATTLSSHTTSFIFHFKSLKMEHLNAVLWTWAVVYITFLHRDVEGLPLCHSQWEFLQLFSWSYYVSMCRFSF